MWINRVIWPNPSLLNNKKPPQGGFSLDMLVGVPFL